MARKTNKSRWAFTRAKKVLVGGVNSPVRAFAAVGGIPPFIARARGAKITDIDGNTYIDYVGSWGPAILGHAHPKVTEAIRRAAAKGATFGAPCPAEIELGERIAAAVPSIEQVRFVSSGTEAVMSAVRLARGVTGRSKIVKCIGCYHGHSDALLVSAGSGVMTLGIPSCPGVTARTTADTLLAPYNDLDAAAKMLHRFDGQIAAFLVEPAAGNMGVVAPREGYLRGLRQLCDKHGVLLIFDEVITGFRLAYSGAQSLYRVRPDITTLGKIIGGGMPVGAYGARREIMKRLAPEGPIYQAGTLSGNPVAMAAGVATLDLLAQKGFYAELERKAATMERLLTEAVREAGVADRVTFNRVGSMMTCFFTAGPVEDYASAARSDTKAYAAYFHAMLEGGVYLAPSQFEAVFVSAAHTRADLERTARAAQKAFAAAKRLMKKLPAGR